MQTEAELEVRDLPGQDDEFIDCQPMGRDDLILLAWVVVLGVLGPWVIVIIGLIHHFIHHAPK